MEPRNEAATHEQINEIFKEDSDLRRYLYQSKITVSQLNHLQSMITDVLAKPAVSEEQSQFLFDFKQDFSQLHAIVQRDQESVLLEHKSKLFDMVVADFLTKKNATIDVFLKEIETAMRPYLPSQEIETKKEIKQEEEHSFELEEKEKKLTEEQQKMLDKGLYLIESLQMLENVNPNQMNIAANLLSERWLELIENTSPLDENYLINLKQMITFLTCIFSMRNDLAEHKQQMSTIQNEALSALEVLAIKDLRQYGSISDFTKRSMFYFDIGKAVESAKEEHFKKSKSFDQIIQMSEEFFSPPKQLSYITSAEIDSMEYKNAELKDYLKSIKTLTVEEFTDLDASIKRALEGERMQELNSVVTKCLTQGAPVDQLIKTINTMLRVGKHSGLAPEAEDKSPTIQQEREEELQIQEQVELLSQGKSYIEDTLSDLLRFSVNKGEVLLAIDLLQQAWDFGIKVISEKAKNSEDAVSQYAQLQANLEKTMSLYEDVFLIRHMYIAKKQNSGMFKSHTPSPDTEVKLNKMEKALVELLQPNVILKSDELHSAVSDILDQTKKELNKSSGLAKQINQVIVKDFSPKEFKKK